MKLGILASLLWLLGFTAGRYISDYKDIPYAVTYGVSVFLSCLLVWVYLKTK